MATATAERRTARRRSAVQWLAATGLVLLSLIPILQGVLRLSELTDGSAITEQNARFFAAPAPAVIHIVSGTIFALLGAFQSVSSRRGRRGWHRIAGLILIPAGLLAALSGLWMALFYMLPASDGALLLAIRLVFGSLMVASIVLGIRAIRRRDFSSHSRWLTRAYAIGVAAGTQALVLALWIILVAPTDETSRALLLGFAWMMNLAVAELVIRRRAVRSAQRPRPEGRTMKAAVYRGQRAPGLVARRRPGDRLHDRRLRYSRSTGKIVVTSGGPYRAEDLAFLVKLAEAGSFRALVDRTYELTDIGEAHGYVDIGRKKGNVVVRIAAITVLEGKTPTHDGSAASTAG